MDIKILNQIKKCEICKINATSLCFECKNYFCEECYNYVHDKMSNSNHKKENIESFNLIDFKCPVHPEYPMNFYCIDENGK